MDTEKLISLVQKYSFLYDKSHKHYCNNNVRENAWEEISKEIKNQTATECKESWKRLRECYRKSLIKKEKSGSQGGVKKDWRFQNELSFLKPYLAPISPQLSNISTENTSQNLIIEPTQYFLLNDNNTIISTEPVTPESVVYIEPETTEGTCAADPNQFTQEKPSTSQATISPSTKTVHSGFKRKRSQTPPSTSVATVLSNYLEKVNPLETNKTDAITHFFLSMAETVKSLPLDLQIATKRRVLEAVTDAEMEAVNRQGYQ
ncbi:uncharacterized protein [Anabrus simplex]|uniref:uncharacterized protein n=1 Tax=Anabrus simplex TaxID=316456 RepID=UPI0035A2FDBD